MIRRKTQKGLRLLRRKSLGGPSKAGDAKYSNYEKALKMNLNPFKSVLMSGICQVLEVRCANLSSPQPNSVNYKGGKSRKKEPGVRENIGGNPKPLEIF